MKSRVILSPEADEVYKYLNKYAPKSKIENTILTALNFKIGLIKENYKYGEPISKKKIPKEYTTKYGAKNLFWVELPSRWRMLYTVLRGENKIEIISFILDVTDHKKYDKIMGYKG